MTASSRPTVMVASRRDKKITAQTSRPSCLILRERFSRAMPRSSAARVMLPLVPSRARRMYALSKSDLALASGRIGPSVGATDRWVAAGWVRESARAEARGSLGSPTVASGRSSVSMTTVAGDHLTAVEDREPLGQVAELADVARPVVACQPPCRLGIELEMGGPCILAAKDSANVLNNSGRSSRRSFSAGRSTAPRRGDTRGLRGTCPRGPASAGAGW